MSLSLLLGSLALLVQSSSYPTGVTIHNPELTQPGLTIEISDYHAYSSSADQEVRARDTSGNIVNTWTSPIPGWNVAELAKPLSNGRLLVLLYEKSRPKSRMLVELDWDGALLWSFVPPAGLEIGRDFDRRPTGNTLVAARRPVKAPRLASASAITHVRGGNASSQLVASGPGRLGDVWDELVLVVDPEGAVARAWSALDHRIELGVPGATWAAFAARSGQGVQDVLRLNSVQSLPPNGLGATDPRFRAGNLLLTFQGISRVLILDRDTFDVVWALPYPTIGPYHARMIPSGLSGAGNLLVYDGGGLTGMPETARLFSRIIEFDPSTGSVVWSYETQVGPSNSAFVHSFYSPTLGGAQRLANGNTLITNGDWGRLFEVDPNGTIVWEFMKSDYKQLYRGFRVSPDWPTGAIPHWTW